MEKIIHFRGRRLRKIKSDHFKDRFDQRVGKFSMEKTNDIVLGILFQIENSSGVEVRHGYKHSVNVLGESYTVVYDEYENKLVTIW